MAAREKVSSAKNSSATIGAEVVWLLKTSIPEEERATMKRYVKVRFERRPKP
jgi:hypothetical protein